MIDSVRIGALEYEVLWTETIEMADMGRVGDCSEQRTRIRVADTLSKGAKANALTHEILHALFNDSGLDLPPDEEERIVSALSPRVLAWIADNPECIRELQEMVW